MPNQTLWRQFELQTGNTKLVCWLEDDPRLKVGTHVTLEETGLVMVWMVTNRYHMTETRGNLHKNSQWKVGGLS